MIAYLALGFLLLAALMVVLEWWARASTAEAKKALMIVGLFLAVLVGFFLLTRGFGVLSALPLGVVAARFFNLTKRLISIAGFLGLGRNRWSQSNDGASGQKGAAANSKISRAEALDILDLKDGASHDEIQANYKRLMAQCHPDKGGSPWMAERLNAARDFLLNDR